METKYQVLETKYQERADQQLWRSPRVGVETKYGDQVSRASWSTEEDIINNKILINESAFFFVFVQ